ncbi:uncharacterized protein BDZ99DRAFT_540234 [Mytilinidion resinicola]|uniref:Secreted protein n=1 Tax=Mytilinidion resinicola TaxID=574789 RepID=A0A6A6YC95_9PEZI|nr:uncharacterized protein BDZ99DRAFT_540234 [Mytilinidion resinicola]KAF2805644.1 hypothetical protein BDZ99DRAFT_540234 [Mytilinidion resinicola]
MDPGRCAWMGAILAATAATRAGRLDDWTTAPLDDCTTGRLHHCCPRRYKGTTSERGQRRLKKAGDGERVASGGQYRVTARSRARSNSNEGICFCYLCSRCVNTMWRAALPRATPGSNHAAGRESTRCDAPALTRGRASRKLSRQGMLDTRPVAPREPVIAPRLPSPPWIRLVHAPSALAGPHRTQSQPPVASSTNHRHPKPTLASIGHRSPAFVQRASKRSAPTEAPQKQRIVAEKRTDRPNPTTAT